MSSTDQCSMCNEEYSEEFLQYKKTGIFCMHCVKKTKNNTNISANININNNTNVNTSISSNSSANTNFNGNANFNNNFNVQTSMRDDTSFFTCASELNQNLALLSLPCYTTKQVTKLTKDVKSGAIKTKIVDMLNDERERFEDAIKTKQNYLTQLLQQISNSDHKVLDVWFKSQIGQIISNGVNKKFFSLIGKRYDYSRNNQNNQDQEQLQVLSIENLINGAYCLESSAINEKTRKINYDGFFWFDDAEQTYFYCVFDNNKDKSIDINSLDKKSNKNFDTMIAALGKLWFLRGEIVDVDNLPTKIDYKDLIVHCLCHDKVCNNDWTMTNHQDCDGKKGLKYCPHGEEYSRKKQKIGDGTVVEFLTSTRCKPVCRKPQTSYEFQGCQHYLLKCNQSNEHRIVMSYKSKTIQPLLFRLDKNEEKAKSKKKVNKVTTTVTKQENQNEEFNKLINTF